MTEATSNHWQEKRTDESRSVEEFLRKVPFEQVDAYRYNPASIRVRIIDSRFEGLSREERDDLIEPYLDRWLMEAQSQEVLSLFIFAPSELRQTPETFRQFAQNLEFEDPSPPVETLPEED